MVFSGVNQTMSRKLQKSLVQAQRIIPLNCEILKSYKNSYWKNISAYLSTSSTFLTHNMLEKKSNNPALPAQCKSTKKISIEGNIACGKSTMLDIFGKRLDVEAVPEQVEKWTNWNGVNMLQAMYDNPAEFGFEFQNIVIKTMVENHLKKTTKRFKLMERSIFSTEQCFIKNSFDDKVFTKTQFDSLSEKCKKLREDLNISVDCFIYMRISPETALHRIKARGRTGEENISLELLQKLHILHEEYVKTLTTTVVIVDANQSLNNVISQFNDILKKMVN